MSLQSTTTASFSAPPALTVHRESLSEVVDALLVDPIKSGRQGEAREFRFELAPGLIALAENQTCSDTLPVSLEYQQETKS